MITLAIVALLAGLAFCQFESSEPNRHKAVEALCELKIQLVTRRAFARTLKGQPVGHVAENLEKVDNTYLLRGVPFVAFGAMSRTGRLGRLKALYSVPVALPGFPGIIRLEVLA